MCACGNDKRPGIRECCAATLDKRFRDEEVTPIKLEGLSPTAFTEYKEELTYLLEVLKSPNISYEVKEVVNERIVTLVKSQTKVKYILNS